MAGIQASTGLISGVAIQDTVEKLMAISAQPRDRLVASTKQLQNEQVSVTSLTALVVGVQLTTDRLGQPSLYTASTASSSNSAVLKSSVTGSPPPGVHTFIPIQQASSQQLTSSLLASKDQLIGAGEIVIERGGFLDESVSLDQLNGGRGVARGSIRITDRTGTSKTVDLRFAQSINDIIEAINKTDGLQVMASVQGDKLKLTDTSGSSISELRVSEVSSGTTAADLGLSGISTASSSATGRSIYNLSSQTTLSTLLDKRGLSLPATGAALELQLRDGSTVTLNSTLNPLTDSLGSLLNAINSAGAGKIEARIASDGKSLEIEDKTTGVNQFSVHSPSGTLATQLGLEQSTSGSTISSKRLIGGLSDVLLSSLNGGKGVGTLGQITLIDRSGASSTVNLADALTLGDVIDKINESSNGVRAQLNRTRTGIEIVDTSGQVSHQLSIANADATNSATALQIEKTVSADTIDSGSLNRQWITENTLLSSWNQGKGISFGSFRIADSAGGQSAINLTQLAPKTVGDVIAAINKLSIGVKASINETGDGIKLVDTANGDGKLTVTNLGSATSATELGIAGTATNLTVAGTQVSGIDGSRKIRVTTSATTTVSDLVTQLNALNGPVNASLLSSTANAGVRLLVSGTSTGAVGRIAFDTQLNIGFSQTSVAKDALVAYGANDAGGGVVVASSTNSFTNLVDGVKLELLGTSNSAITVTIERNNSGVAKQIQLMVEQFNKVRDKLNADAKYDPATKTAGILFGTSTALRTEMAFTSLFSRNLTGAGSIKSIAELGVRFNDQGKLQFDQAKLDAALEKDPAAVRDFFTKAEVGFSAKAKAVSDSLASIKNGALLTRNNALQSKIEVNNQRISSFNVRLEKQRTAMLTQFYNMETAISKIQSNLTAINSIDTTLTSWSK
jgi:flagellar hook-associated protein 2